MAGRSIRCMAVLSFCALSLSAQDTPTFQLTPEDGGRSVRISLALEDDLLNINVPDPPVVNMRISGGRRSGFEMHWSPEGLARRRVYEWTAIPEAGGIVAVGPLTIGRGVSAVTVPRAELRVGQRAAPGDVRLEVELSSAAVDLGEQVSVTWTLVSSEQIRDIRVIENASFEGFWVEEIPITGERDSLTWRDGAREHSLLLRRAVLYPLQTGALPIRPMHVEAEMLVARDFRSPFSIFEGRFRRVSTAADAVLVRVGPRNPQAQVTGYTTMQCAGPVVSSSGNVTWDVTVRSVGNLRVAEPPAFASELGAATEVEDLGQITVERAIGGVRMTRRWRRLIFPQQSGRLAVPDLVFRYWDPAESTLRTITCPGAVLAIPERGDAPADPPDPGGGAQQRQQPFPVVAVIVLSALAATGAFVLFRRRRQQRSPEIEFILSEIRAASEPREQRERLEIWLRERGFDPYELAWTPGEQGERWRAVLSLLETYERNVLSGRDELELERRIAVLARSL